MYQFFSYSILQLYKKNHKSIQFIFFYLKLFTRFPVEYFYFAFIFPAKKSQKNHCGKKDFFRKKNPVQEFALSLCFQLYIKNNFVVLQ